MGKSKDLATGASYVDTSGDTMTGALNINAQNTKISQSSNHLILHDTSEADSGSNWWYMYRTTGDGKLRFYRGNDKLTIDGSGAVSTPYQPAFMVNMTSPPTLTGSSTTTLPWNNEIYDTGSNFNTSNYRFTAPVSGKYFMHLHFEFHSDSNWSNSTWAYIGDYFVNGTRKTGADFWGHSGKYNLASNAVVLELNANDYVDVRAVPNGNTLRYSGDSAGSFGNSRWFGYLIG